MRKHVYWALCALVLLAGCNRDTKVVTNVGPTPVPSGSSPPVGPVVTLVSVSADKLDFTFNTCPVTVGITAKVEGTGVTQTVSWRSTGGGVFNHIDPNPTATFIINQPGVYTATATSTQADKSGTITITAKGTGCAAPGPGPGPAPGPGPTDTFSISFVPHGDTKPIGTRQVLTATCKKNGSAVPCTSAKWTSSVTDVIRIIGSDVGQTVMIEYVSPHTAVVTATWEGVSDSAAFRGTEEGSAPPPPPPPPAAPMCLSFTASNSNVVKGTEITLTHTANEATVSVDGFGDWTRTGMPRNGSQTIVPNKAVNTYSIRCNGAPGTTPDTRTITVTTFEAPAVCPSTVDYTPAGGTLALGQSRTLTVTGLPADAPCDPFWGVDRPDLGSLIGAEKTILIDGVWYPVGRTAIIKRIFRGTFRGFVQPSVVNANKTWHTWTDATTFLAVESDPIPPGMIMFEVRADGSVWYQGKPVAQTGPPSK